jgi:predicted ATPase/DNA-binding CsgD family transcriptional regulator
MPGPQHGFSEDLAGDPGSLVASPKTTARSLPRNNLPLELSSFVGRGREINEIEGLLTDHRLLTLAGPGGSGKTRLALRVAAEVAEGFEDGVWLVELAPLSDPDLVSRAVASVLGVRETPGTDLVDSLCVYLASRGTTLLILDNCEHIVDACASLSEALLHRCAKLRILATSRETLRVPGETLFAVPPLSLPDPRHSPTVASLPAYEATGLFVERTRAVKPDFSLTEGNAMAVAQVCYRLDGIPLALELAAARARVLSVEQISSRLDESFRLLTASGRRDIPHHRTLRATMDWSYELLRVEEQTLFRRLSVFAGGWTLEAAEEVCAGEGLEQDEVLDLLTSLVDKSLVLVSEQDGEARYRLLETVRQYGREKLEESGEAGEMRGRHAEHYYTLALEAGPLMMGRDQVGWLDRTWREQHNFRAAMRFFLDRKDAARAIGLTWAFWRYWWVTGLQGEARRWMEEALQSGDLPGDDVYPALKAQANLIIGTYAWSEGDLASALPALEEGLRLSRQTGDARGQAIGLMLLGLVDAAERNGERSRERFEESLRLFRISGESEKWGEAHTLAYLGLAPMLNGEPEPARRCFEEGLAAARAAGDRIAAHQALYKLGLLALAERDLDRADEYLREGLSLADEVRDIINSPYFVKGLGQVAGLRGQAAFAVRLLGAAETALRATGSAPYRYIPDEALQESIFSAARDTLGEAAFDEGWRRGRAMTLQEAVEYALQPPAPEEPVSPPTTAYPAGLSAREVEVLRLVANGLTNAQIARELYISPRTVNAHMGSVYHKIGSSTRAEAARFASEHGLI